MAPSQSWHLYTGTGTPREGEVTFPPTPPWRSHSEQPVIERFVSDSSENGILERGKTYQATNEEVDMVNAALYLRRPLLITGIPGTGKSSLAYSVARELKLGSVLRWNITSRSTLQDGLYRYDAIARLQDSSLSGDDKKVPDIGRYIRLGALGTALLPTSKPRVLLIDEIDKSDIDLPNDLLNIFEEGEFLIPELFRLKGESKKVDVYPADAVDDQDMAPVVDGRVCCREFPFVVLTSNAEREFSPAFLRRCIRLHLLPPSPEKLLKIVEAHMLPMNGNISDGEREEKKLQYQQIIDNFVQRRKSGELATDQLLHVIYMTSQFQEGDDGEERKNKLMEKLLNPLNSRVNL